MRENPEWIREDQSPAADEGLTFEAALAELETVVRDLEGGELTLDEAIDRFQRGMRLAGLCREKLRAAEQKVEIVLSAEDGVSARPFSVDE